MRRRGFLGLLGITASGVALATDIEPIKRFWFGWRPKSPELSAWETFVEGTVNELKGGVKIHLERGQANIIVDELIAGRDAIVALPEFMTVGFDIPKSAAESPMRIVGWKPIPTSGHVSMTFEAIAFAQPGDVFMLDELPIGVIEHVDGDRMSVQTQGLARVRADADSRIGSRIARLPLRK